MLIGMGVQIAVRLADEDLESLDAAIARGAFPSRAAAIRAGLHCVLREEREAQIEAAYRLAAGDAADDGIGIEIGEAGLLLGAALLSDHERGRGERER